MNSKIYASQAYMMNYGQLFVCFYVEILGCLNMSYIKLYNYCWLAQGQGLFTLIINVTFLWAASLIILTLCVNSTIRLPWTHFKMLQKSIFKCFSLILWSILVVLWCIDWWIFVYSSNDVTSQHVMLRHDVRFESVRRKSRCAFSKLVNMTHSFYVIVFMTNVEKCNYTNHVTKPVIRVFP